MVDDTGDSTELLTQWTRKLSSGRHCPDDQELMGWLQTFGEAVLGLTRCEVAVLQQVVAQLAPRRELEDRAGLVLGAAILDLTRRTQRGLAHALDQEGRAPRKLTANVIAWLTERGTLESRLVAWNELGWRRAPDLPHASARLDEVLRRLLRNYRGADRRRAKIAARIRNLELRAKLWWWSQWIDCRPDVLVEAAFSGSELEDRHLDECTRCQDELRVLRAAALIGRSLAPISAAGGAAVTGSLRAYPRRRPERG